MGAARAKGTRWETELARWFNTNGWPQVERRALRGQQDRGDLIGIPGVVIEAKNHSRLELAGWCDQLRAEITNARAGTGAVIARRRGSPARDAYVIMPLDIYTRLLAETDR